MRTQYPGLMRVITVLRQTFGSKSTVGRESGVCQLCNSVAFTGRGTSEEHSFGWQKQNAFSGNRTRLLSLGEINHNH